MYKLEKNMSDYWNFILELRNDPRVKKGFIQQEQISRQEHSMYMQAFALTTPIQSGILEL